VQPYAGFEPQVGEIRATRTFRVGPGGVLYPLFSATPWRPGDNTAACRVIQPAAGALPPHLVPDPSCSCGFYAYGSAAAAGEYPHARHVLAVVACWGRVIAGTRGIRAEHGRIEAVWVSEQVPADLVASIVTRYPAVTVYPDKSAMLAAHPLTALDCYEDAEIRRASAARRWLQAVAGASVAVSTLPAHWLGGTHQAQPVWCAALAVFLATGLLLGRGVRTDAGLRRRLLFFHAGLLWMIAPFAGTLGLVLLRLPLLQLGVLGLAHHRQLVRAASRFPADIS
jgi:hypothetical protein